MSAQLMAMVVEGKTDRLHIAPVREHEILSIGIESYWKPDQELQGKCRVSVPLYGMNTFGDLFTERQLATLSLIAERLIEASEVRPKNWTNPDRSEMYALDRDPQDPESFAALPHDVGLVTFDRSDRKFVALAVVSGAPVWNAVDTDWWAHRAALARHAVQIEFICSDYFKRQR